MFNDNNVDFLEQKRLERGARRKSGAQRGAQRGAGGTVSHGVTRETVKSVPAGTRKPGAGAKAGAGKAAHGGVRAVGKGVGKALAGAVGKGVFVVVCILAIGGVWTACSLPNPFSYLSSVFPSTGHDSGSHITAGDSSQDSGSGAYNSDSGSGSGTYSSGSADSYFAYPTDARLVDNSFWEFELDGGHYICAVLDVDIDTSKESTMIGGVVETADRSRTLSYDIGAYYTVDESFEQANDIAMKSGYYCEGTAIVLAQLYNTCESGYAIQLYKEDYSTIDLQVAPGQVQKTTKEAVSDAIVRLGSENADVKASIDRYGATYPSSSSSSSAA